MNGQEKVIRIRLLVSNLLMTGLPMFSGGSFISCLRMKCPFNPLPEGPMEVVPTWSYAEYVKVMEVLHNQVSKGLIPFLKDEVLIALAHEGLINACKKLRVTETVFLEEQKKDALGRANRGEEPITNMERIRFMTRVVGQEMDTVFKDNAKAIDILFMYEPYLYKDFLRLFAENPGICLSSVPETDFDANFRDLLNSIKKDS